MTYGLRIDGCLSVTVISFVSVRRNHWAGAKALAKLIKPKNRQDSSRERVRSAPDIPLPEPPTLEFPDIPPPLPPPPLPPRQSRLSLDSVGNHSQEENHHGQGHSPTLTYSSRGKTDSGWVGELKENAVYFRLLIQDCS